MSALLYFYSFDIFNLAIYFLDTEPPPCPVDPCALRRPGRPRPDGGLRSAPALRPPSARPAIQAPPAPTPDLPPYYSAPHNNHRGRPRDAPGNHHHNRQTSHVPEASRQALPYPPPLPPPHDQAHGVPEARQQVHHELQALPQADVLQGSCDHHPRALQGLRTLLRLVQHQPRADVQGPEADARRPPPPSPGYKPYKPASPKPYGRPSATKGTSTPTAASHKPSAPTKSVLAPLAIPVKQSGLILPDTPREGPFNVWAHGPGSEHPRPPPFRRTPLGDPSLKAERRQRLQVPDSVVRLLNSPQPGWVASLEPDRR
ncbi:extensin-like [Penaeus monodon]|uniref:extensin-like n=1 Tax=Penaeus monodon TaxID=6687 RepID=UPI0018A743A5|nr:extensin-like [Penaeus monodon]